MADMSSTLECPVCSVVFTDPKLLNCNHIVCGPCIVSWLRKAGPNGGCPLCRSSIFPSLLSSSQDDLQAVVDDLPTDLTMVMRVKSFQLLNSGQVCMSCDNTTTAATSVCIQCSMKLCQACSQAHTEFPAMENHVLEPLDNLTAERLNRMSRTICKSHSDQQAELYCCSHQELMCSLCFHVSHRPCAEVKTIEEAATERREMRKLEAERLREKEAAMRTQIKNCREKFTHMRAKAKEAFDDLQQCVEKRREEVNALIQAEEDKVKVPLAELDHACAATMSQAGVMDDVVESASDDVLLDMEKVMMSGLKQLEQQTARAVVMQDPADIQCDPQELTMLKTAIAALPATNAPHSLTKHKIQLRSLGGHRGPESQWREQQQQQQRVISPKQEPRLVRSEDFQRAQMAASRSVPDFTPGFFKSYPRSGPSLTKRNRKKRGRGGPGSQSGEQQQQRIIISTRQERQLHKSENACKPQFQAEADMPVDEKELKDLQHKFQSILNKLTPEKFSKLVVQALEMKIDTEERLTAVTNLIFEKAIAEEKFTAVYADFCRELLKLPKVLSTDKEREVTFRGLLLTKCQKEFEKDKATDSALENKKRELESALASNAPQEQTNRLKEELEMEMKKACYRSVGNICFIGELFRLKMLTENIMHDCIFKLLKTRDDKSMECLTKLLDTIGADLDHAKAKVRMDQYFVEFEKMTADMQGPQGELSRDAKSSQAGGAGSQSSKKDGAELSSRVKLAILDIIDLRKNNWVKRRIHDQNRPTTLGAIHQKAKEEEQAAQFLNSQPRQEPSAARGGARPKGRGSAQGDMDGWNTVPPRQVKQQIEPTRMKLTEADFRQFFPYPQHQPRMPFPAPMPQQQQMGFMPQYGPTNTAYAAPATYYHHQPPMAMPSTSRPSSAGPQGAMGGGPELRSRKMLSLTDPNTGEDITEKVFKPMSGEELDPSMLESQAHREAVHLEFATKVAFLAKDKKEEQQTPHIPIRITAPPPQHSVHHAVVMEEISVAPPNVQEQPQHAVPTVPMEQPMPVMNGEPETNIPEQDVSTQPPASYSTSAKEFEPSPLSQSVETVAAAPEVQTPSPAQPSAPPVMPMAADMAASVEVAPQKKDLSPPPRVDMVPPSVVETAPVPVVEKSPPPIVETPAPAAVVEKEPTPPVESAAMVPPSTAMPMQSMSVSAADAAKVITDDTTS